MPLNVRLAEAMGYFGVVIIDSSRVVSIALVIVVVGGYLELFVSFQDIASQDVCENKWKTKQAPVSNIWPLIYNYGNLSKAQIRGIINEMVSNY